MQTEQYLKELRDRYTKDWTDRKERDIEEYINRFSLSENELRDWMVAIKENYTYSTFPLLSNIKKYLKRKHKDDRYYWNPDFWRNIDAWEIYQLWIKIEDKIKKLSNYEGDNNINGFYSLTNKEQDIYLHFQDFHTEYTYMTEKDYSTQSKVNRLEFLKKKILAGEQYTLLEFQKNINTFKKVDCLVSHVEQGIKEPDNKDERIPENPEWFNY